MLLLPWVEGNGSLNVREYRHNILVMFILVLSKLLKVMAQLHLVCINLTKIIIDALIIKAKIRKLGVDARKLLHV